MHASCYSAQQRTAASARSALRERTERRLRARSEFRGGPGTEQRSRLAASRASQ